jgi:hypothetical protein
VASLALAGDYWAVKDLFREQSLFLLTYREGKEEITNLRSAEVTSVHVGTRWHTAAPVERAFDRLPLRIRGQISVGDFDQITKVACWASAKT